MNNTLITVIDQIVHEEFSENFDLYNFEKEQLFETLQQEKESVKLNEFGIQIDAIPAYILAITSIVNLYMRFQQHRKKISKAELKSEMQKNQLPDQVTDVLLHKYAEVLIHELNQVKEKEED